MKGLEPGALGLRLGEMVGVGERQAHIGRHVLEQPDVPIVEGAVVVRLQREHGGDPISAEDRHPYERAGHVAVLAGGARYEHGGSSANVPTFALEALALEASRPR